MGLALAVLGPACQGARGGPADGAPEGGRSDRANAGRPNRARAVSRLSIDLARAATGEVEERVEVSGTLAAWEEATVAMEAEGRLVEVRADLGDRVKKGEVLARVGAREYELRLDQARADLQAAGTELGRVRELLARELAPRQQLDEVLRRQALAEVAVALAQKKLADAVLRSPLDGAVARRLVNEGEYVRTGTPAFHLVRTAPLCFRGEVPERYAIALREGAEVNARTAAAPGLVLRGTVTRISPAVTVESRGLPFEAQVENPGDILKPGAFATLSVLLGRRPALVVPEGAVLLSAGVARAWVVVDGRVHERLLTLDGRSGNLLRVRSGLVAGETVAASAVERLTEGQAVQARPTGGRP